MEQLTAEVAHDLNNALAPLLTYAELLADDPQLEGPARKWAELIRLGAAEAAAIVRRLDPVVQEFAARKFAGQSAPSSPRVLFVDDDTIVRESTAALLASFSMEVRMAADGFEALRCLEAERFDLVLCDQGLPGMDGLAVLAEIKRRWPELPVVLVSGWSIPQRDESPAPDGFIQKPFQGEDLERVLTRFSLRSFERGPR